VVLYSRTNPIFPRSQVIRITIGAPLVSHIFERSRWRAGDVAQTIAETVADVSREDAQLLFKMILILKHWTVIGKYKL
jgi:hypothetical protein